MKTVISLVAGVVLQCSHLFAYSLSHSWAKSAVCMLTHQIGSMQSLWFKATFHKCSGNILKQAFCWRNCVKNAFSIWPHFIYFVEFWFGRERVGEGNRKIKHDTARVTFLKLLICTWTTCVGKNWMVLKTSCPCPICSVLQGYGKADHSVTVEILKKEYTDYEITWSDDKK